MFDTIRAIVIYIVSELINGVMEDEYTQMTADRSVILELEELYTGLIK